MRCTANGNHSLKFSILASVILVASTLHAEPATEAVTPAHCPTCGMNGVAGGYPACFPARAGYMTNYGRCGPRCQAALSHPWNCGYYYTPWGSPVALVVPPTAERQYSMGWGVGNTRLTRIYQQFGRPYPGVAMGPGGRFLATPYWPSDTAQFGVYYVRGPW